MRDALEFWPIIATVVGFGVWQVRQLWRISVKVAVIESAVEQVEEHDKRLRSLEGRKR